MEKYLKKAFHQNHLGWIDPYIFGALLLKDEFLPLKILLNLQLF